MRKRTTYLVVELALALLSLPALASNASAFELGLQDDAVFYDDHRREWGLDHAVRLGVKRVRLNVAYGDIYRGGRLDFDRLDRTVDAIRKRGIWVQLTLMGNPTYYSGAEASDTVRHNNIPLRKWAVFVSRVARHYQRRVTRYSVWNEPNHLAFLAPSDPQHYRRIYDTAYRVLKRVSRRNKVLFGELAPFANANDWLWGVVGKRKMKADGFAMHPYQTQFVNPGRTFRRGRRTLGISNTGYLRRQLRILHKRRLLTTPRGSMVPFYLTEFGYRSPGSISHPVNDERAVVAEDRRADLYRDAIRQARRAKAKQLVLFQLMESPAGHEWNTGLVLRNGTPTPAYWAVAREMD